ncbi:hypothetical protein [Bosea sp. TAB14]|uniref:hypothetical protein n=1 Tax=Bosea sp. TAB14 TaxID=3237481 RepID=UPI003F8F13D4
MIDYDTIKRDLTGRPMQSSCDRLRSGRNPFVDTVHTHVGFSSGIFSCAAAADAASSNRFISRQIASIIEK